MTVFLKKINLSEQKRILHRNLLVIFNRISGIAILKKEQTGYPE